MGNGDNFRSRVHKFTQLIEIDLVRRGQLDNAKLRTRCKRELLPWHEVRVMLNGGDDNLIPRLYVRSAPR